MSAPVALAGLSFAGSALQSRGEAASGRDEQRAYNARAFNQELTAADLETQSLLQSAQTTFELDKLRGKMKATRGSQMAAVAASGVTYSGSARQFVEADATAQEYDALMLQFSGNAKTMGLKRNAEIERMNAGILKSEATVARKNAKAKGATTLLTGAANAGKNMYMAQSVNSVGGTNGSNS